MSSKFTCDTSVLVPALVAWHPDHDSAREALRPRLSYVPAHVLLETYSVLTRLPAPHRLAPSDAAHLVSAVGAAALSLPGPEQADLVSALGRAQVRGGAAYDALVAQTAHHHGLRLLTRDRRARRVYDLIGVDYSLI